jgi:WD repeat-containing protein 61
VPIYISHIQNYTGHRGAVFAMLADAEEQFLYSSGDDGVVAKWNIEDAEAKGILQTDTAVYSMALAENLGLLLVGTRNGTVYITDLKNHQLRHSFRKFTGAIYNIYYDAEKKNAWILCADGWLIIWDLEEMKEITSLRISEKHLRSIVPYKENMLIGASDGNIYILQKSDFSLISHFFAHENSVFALCISPNQQVLFSGGRDAYLNAWDMSAHFSSLQKIAAHNFTINDIVILPAQQLLATASRDKTIKLWDISNLALLKVVDFARNQGHFHSVNKLCMLSQKNVLISCGDDKKIIMWEVLSNNE